MPSYKIGLAQIDVVPGNPERNVENMVSIMQANKGKLDIIAFPEMAVGGYLLGDLWLNEDWCDYLESFNESIRQASADLGMTVIYGNVYICRDGRKNQDGRRRKYNAAYIFNRGRAPQTDSPFKMFPDGIQPKSLLPNYRFFDDRRFFFSLVDAALDYGVRFQHLVQPFKVELDGGEQARIGLFTCEDLWCSDYRMDNSAINISRYLTDAGAEILVNISASPWTWGKNAARDRQVEFVLAGCRNKRPIFYVNRCGAENCGDNVITYDGGSTIYNEDALPVLLANNRFREEILVCELVKHEGVFITENGAEKRMILTPVNVAPTPRPTEPKVAQKLTALIRGVQHIAVMTGMAKPKFLIGLSGGIDSTVSACVVERAFGKDAVIGVTMPGPFTGE